MKFFLTQPDKQGHFVAGSCIASACAFATHGSILLVALAPTVVGILKELNDLRLNKAAAKRGEPAPHGVEVLDAIATALPGWIMAAFLYYWKNWS